MNHTRQLVVTPDDPDHFLAGVEAVLALQRDTR
jgi:hypothetical protein